MLEEDPEEDVEEEAEEEEVEVDPDVPPVDEPECDVEVVWVEDDWDEVVFVAEELSNWIKGFE